MTFVVWKGKGLLFFILPILTAYVVDVLLGSLGVGGYIVSIIDGTIMLLVGILCWIIGKKINNAQIVPNGTDNEESITIKNQHTFFWIPVQYLSIFYILFAFASF